MQTDKHIKDVLMRSEEKRKKKCFITRLYDDFRNKLVKMGWLLYQQVLTRSDTGYLVQYLVLLVPFCSTNKCTYVLILSTEL